MCWAMLAAPADATPAALVAAATAAVPDAPRLLSGGGLALAREMDEQHKAAFLVDVLELYSCRREVRQIQSRLRSGGEADTKELLGRALELRRRESELIQLIPAAVSG
jgi:DNA primase